MRVLASQRSSKALGSLASALSLALANYKPIPQLPVSNTSLSNGTSSSGAHQLLPVSSSSSSSTSYKTQTSKQASVYDDQHPVSEWGEPSTLYVPKSDANQLKSSSTIGPGNCPVTSTYTPQGGWDNLPAPTYPAFDPVAANVYRYRQQQGVNLGGWFVQEGWMEGNFMSCANGTAEFDLISSFGTTSAGMASARAYMEKHWDTWIQESDFQKMQTMGINTVRIPIGYWSVGPYFCKGSVFEPYGDIYYFSWRYIARAINWASKYNMGVIIDLHGAYGSQNGQDHSGVSNGNVGFFTAANEQLTTNLLVWIAHEISAVTNVVGIEVLNEPQNRPSLWTWYNNVMDTMRNASTAAATIPLYFQDAFDLDTGASFVAARKDFVVQDHHSYFVYTAADQAESAADHTKDIEGTYTNKLQAESNIARRNVVTGEWSCALAPSSLAGSSHKKQDQINYCEAQVEAYAKTNAGYQYWSWTMENCASNSGWCFQQTVASGLLTTPLDSWGLGTHTKNYFSALNTSKADQVISKLASKITAIPFPKTVSSFSSSTSITNNAVVKLAKADNSDDDDEEDNDASNAVPVNVKGFIDMLDDDNESKEAARVGNSVHDNRRGNGSPAARAHDLVKRATTNAQLAAFYGYNDGFKSARYFAANAQLSRLGFAIQYRADSYRARIAHGSIQSGDLANYKAQYAAGVLAAEASIASIINAS